MRHPRVAGRDRLYISDVVIEEVRDVTARPWVASRFGVTAEQVEALLEHIGRVAIPVSAAPQVYQHPYDPDDSHYVNLALAARAHLVVSRDRDLLNLMDLNRQEGCDFRKRFPQLRIVDPPTLLHELRVK